MVVLVAKDVLTTKCGAASDSELYFLYGEINKQLK